MVLNSSKNKNKNIGVDFIASKIPIEHKKIENNLWLNLICMTPSYSVVSLWVFYICIYIAQWRRNIGKLKEEKLILLMLLISNMYV